MENSSNLQIVKRLLELAKNRMEGYTLFPRPYKEEQVWLSNVLHDSLSRKEAEFKAKFQEVVGHYKSSLKEGKGYGWFHSPEKLSWIKMQINQLNYAIYGDDNVLNRDLIFKEELGNDAYREFICQIDRTVLMTPKELQKHNNEINRMAKEIMAEILAEEKLEQKKKS